ncbi:uncharacterized protein LOC135821349 [Sycon ciliatum]|uniref:uncharacterized protein LOC135821349 n=1 Tax=Sycon ciliatum TaxID=27933 RepID=UPI0031F64026
MAPPLMSILLILLYVGIAARSEAAVLQERSDRNDQASRQEHGTSDQHEVMAGENVVEQGTAQRAAGAAAAAAAAPRVGAIRWDDWAGPGLDVTQDAPLKCLSQPQYHYRLPFFAKVINNTSVTWSETTQAVMDQEINYAANGGLKYWAFCTYPLKRCDQDAPSNVTSCPLSWALEKYLNSSLAHKINFSLILQAHWNSWPNVSDWDEKVERYSDYFAMANYEKALNGQPLVFLFGVSEGSLAPFGGSKGFKPYLDKLTQASRNKTGQPPYYCLLSSNVNIADTLDIDCFSAYAMSGGSAEGSPYAKQMLHSQTMWNDWRGTGKHVIPQAPTGWDPRPRFNFTPPWSHGQGLNHYVTARPSEVATMLQMAFKWIDTYPDSSPSRHVLMYAWNEGTEGGWLWPTLDEGTARLDAISHVISSYGN